MSHNHALQTDFLEDLQKNQVTVSIFLVNGIKLHGVIEKIDDEVILLKNVYYQDIIILIQV